MSISSSITADSKALGIAEYFSQNIVFIDAQVEDYQSLIDGVVPGTEVILLNSTQDGVEQITQHLVNRSNVDSVHIVSHGSPGCLYLGNSQLSLDTLEDYKSQLQAAFSNSAHLLLYGCNVAAGDAGTEFIEKLHQLTGVEIAASASRVGHAAKGGSWQLECCTNQMESDSVFLPELMQTYSGVFVLTVDTLVDENDGNFTPGDVSLREAIDNAISGEVINFDFSLVGGTITLTEGQLNIDKSLTINGLGADQLTISGNNASRVFNIDDGNENTFITVEIEGLTITEGKNTGDLGTGAGIQNNENLTVTNSIITNNESTGLGAGISNSGELNLFTSTVSNNKISNFPNSGGLFTSGGGIFNFSGADLDIERSTISGNQANRGGGIHNEGNLEVANSTISGNQSSEAGGGILLRGSSPTADISFSTIVNNESNLVALDRGSGGGIAALTGTPNISNTIIAGNSGANPDVEGNFTSNGNNLIGDGTGSMGFTNGVNGDQVGTNGNPIDPLLGPLTNNGGPTETHAVLEDSPAINAGSNPLGLTTDQRGEARVQQGVPDIGAFESNLLPDASFIVNSLEDNINPNDSLTTLREAIIEANNTPGLDTIEFDTGLTGGTIHLTNGTLEITDDLSIDGLGSNNLSVSGNTKFDLFGINNSSEVSIQELTITQGRNGIVLDDDSSLELFDITVSFNTGVGISGDNNSNIKVGFSSIENNGSHGIELGDNSNLESGNSRIENNLGNGIQLDDDTVALMNHTTIKNNGGTGIVGANGNELDFSSGIITDNGGDGIELDSDNQLTVFFSGIGNNGGNGIQFDEENTLTVIDSSINNNTHLGILGSNDNNLEINNSTINNNDAGGIKLEDGNTLMTLESDILLNGGNGIEFNDENRVKVEQSRIENNSGIGLSGDNDNEIIVCSSTIDHNGDDGILIQDNNLITLIQQTSISNNLGDGVSIGDDNPPITVGTIVVEGNGGLDFRGVDGNFDTAIDVNFGDCDFHL